MGTSMLEGTFFVGLTNGRRYVSAFINRIQFPRAGELDAVSVYLVDLAQASTSRSPTTPATMAAMHASLAAEAASPWTMPAATTPTEPMPTHTA